MGQSMNGLYPSGSQEQRQPMNTPAGDQLQIIPQRPADQAFQNAAPAAIQHSGAFNKRPPAQTQNYARNMQKLGSASNKRQSLMQDSRYAPMPTSAAQTSLQGTNQNPQLPPAVGMDQQTVAPTSTATQASDQEQEAKRQGLQSLVDRPYSW